MAMATEALDPSAWHPERLAGLLRNKRLTVLYGPPGPWRDGMVRRGLMPLLLRPQPPVRDRTHARQVPIRFDGWGSLPLQALRTRIDAEFSAAWPHDAPHTLAAHLRAIGQQHHATVLLVLDAFERHLHERAAREDIERFDIELSECIAHEEVPVHVLLVVDEGSSRALQRYTHRIGDFGDDCLRLPGLALQTAEAAAPWRDTDIEAPRDGGDDAAALLECEADWPLDLSLDLESPAPAARRAAATSRLSDVPGARREPEGAAETRRSGAAAPQRIEPDFGADGPPAPPPPAPPDPPSRKPTEQPLGSWPPLGAPPAAAAAPAQRSLPPWLSEADVERMQHAVERAPRWPALLGLALYLAVLFAGAWWAGRWILDSQRLETGPPGVDTAQPPRTPAPTPPVEATAPGEPPPTTAPAPAPLSPAPPATHRATSAPAPRALTLALPPDAGSAAPLVDELVQRVAAPAGLELRIAAGPEAAALALMRTDALLDARAANASPLQVVAPLYTERIQVLVSTDARWDYVHQIKGLRLNIGRAEGARARTVRALYRQLFGVPLPQAQANELDLDVALQQLPQRGSPIDAVVVVSDAPLLPQLQPALRRRVRELTLDPRHAGTVTALPAFSISRRTPNERARLSVATFLVAPGAAPSPNDAALRALAAALCRAQPALQASDSSLLRGWRQGQQPDVGWPYVLARTPNALCPAP